MPPCVFTKISNSVHRTSAGLGQRQSNQNFHRAIRSTFDLETQHKSGGYLPPARLGKA